MDIFLSSPILIVALFLAIAIIAVFIFELKMSRKREEAQPPLPPTSIPIPKKKPPLGKKKLILASGSIIVLLIGLSISFYLIGQRQLVVKEAEVPKPTPTPTTVLPPLPSPTSALIIPSPTPTAEVAQILKAQNPPQCISITAEPTTGRAPLTVNFEAMAEDDEKISAFEFYFGTGATQTIEKDYEKTASQSMQMTYTEPGSYTAQVRVRDNQDNWSDFTAQCRQTITVESSTSQTETSGLGGQGPEPTATKTPTPTPTLEVEPTLTPVVQPDLPEAGLITPTAIVLLFGIVFMLASMAMIF